MAEHIGQRVPQYRRKARGEPKRGWGGSPARMRRLAMDEVDDVALDPDVSDVPDFYECRRPDKRHFATEERAAEKMAEAPGDFVREVYECCGRGWTWGRL